MSLANLTSVDTALQHLLESAKPLSETEMVPLGDALGRILAEDLSVPMDVPQSDNSAVDGYAFRCADPGAARRLPVSSRVAAGDNPPPLEAGTAARIFTGAPIPEGADTVIMQENTTLDDNGHVSFESTPPPGQNIRRRGQDLQKGTVALSSGTRLRPQELGLIASLGCDRVPVWRRLRVAILTTGDELVEPGRSLTPGQIYNTNRYTLQGLLQQLDCEVVACQTVPDRHEATVTALKEAAARADLIITSGGVSVGEEDHLRAALEETGELSLWRLAIKPGKPLAFGQIADVPVLGLPGNPAAVLVTTLVIAAPFIRRCQGNTGLPPKPAQLPAAFTLDKASIRREFVRARRELHNGQTVAAAYPNQSSGMLSSACWADGLAVIPENTTVKPGDMVSFYAFSDLTGA